MLHVQCGFGIVLTESESEDFFGPLGCCAAIDGAFCCGSASLGGGLGAGEAPPSTISVGSAMPRNSASLRGAARRRLNDATKKSLRQRDATKQMRGIADGFGWGRRSDICNKYLGGSIGVICRRNQWHN